MMNGSYSFKIKQLFFDIFIHRSSKEYNRPYYTHRNKSHRRSLSECHSISSATNLSSLKLKLLSRILMEGWREILTLKFGISGRISGAERLLLIWFTSGMMLEINSTWELLEAMLGLIQVGVFSFVFLHIYVLYSLVRLFFDPSNYN
jgi:hypothetical protein